MVLTLLIFQHICWIISIVVFNGKFMLKNQHIYDRIFIHQYWVPKLNFYLDIIILYQNKVWWPCAHLFFCVLRPQISTSRLESSMKFASLLVHVGPEEGLGSSARKRLSPTFREQDLRAFPFPILKKCDLPTSKQALSNLHFRF